MKWVGRDPAAFRDKELGLVSTKGFLGGIPLRGSLRHPEEHKGERAFQEKGK